MNSLLCTVALFEVRRRIPHKVLRNPKSKFDSRRAREVDFKIESRQLSIPRTVAHKVAQIECCPESWVAKLLLRETAHHF
jgi:hypothetical protein